MINAKMNRKYKTVVVIAMSVVMASLSYLHNLSVKGTFMQA